MYVIEVLAIIIIIIINVIIIVILLLPHVTANKVITFTSKTSTWMLCQYCSQLDTITGQEITTRTLKKDKLRKTRARNFSSYFWPK